jgi:hypothetical protein
LWILECTFPLLFHSSWRTSHLGMQWSIGKIILFTTSKYRNITSNNTNKTAFTNSVILILQSYISIFMYNSTILAAFNYNSIQSYTWKCISKYKLVHSFQFVHSLWWHLHILISLHNHMKPDPSKSTNCPQKTDLGNMTF